MTEKFDYIKIDIKSFQDMCKQITDLKAQCKELSKENLFLKSEIQDLKFTQKYLTGEEAGAAFARSLLRADIEEEIFLAAGEAEYERTWNIADGDDF